MAATLASISVAVMTKVVVQPRRTAVRPYDRVGLTKVVGHSGKGAMNHAATGELGRYRYR